jgi:hypothetical protein
MGKFKGLYGRTLEEALERYRADHKAIPAGRQEASEAQRNKLDGLLASKGLTLEAALERYSYPFRSDGQGKPFLDKELAGQLISVMLNPVRHNRDQRDFAENHIKEAECLEMFASWDDAEWRRRATLLVEQEIEEDYRRKVERADLRARRAIGITEDCSLREPVQEEQPAIPYFDDDDEDGDGHHILVYPDDDDFDPWVASDYVVAQVAKVERRPLTEARIDQVAAEYKRKYSNAIECATAHREAAARCFARIDEVTA